MTAPARERTTACSVIPANALGYLRSATGGGESKHLYAMCVDGMVFDQVSFGIRYSQPLLLPAIFCPPLLALSVVARHRPAEANLRRLAMPLSTTQAARIGGREKEEPRRMDESGTERTKRAHREAERRGHTRRSKRGSIPWLYAASKAAYIRAHWLLHLIAYKPRLHLTWHRDGNDGHSRALCRAR